jgi:hypothetical protein
MNTILLSTNKLTLPVQEIDKSNTSRLSEYNYKLYSVVNLLVCSAILIQFIRLPNLPKIDIDLYNIIILTLLTLSFPRLFSIRSINLRNMILILIFVLYPVYHNILNIIHGHDTISMMSFFRTASLFFVILLHTENKMQVYLWTKALVLGIFASTIIGLLIYSYGGVFIEMRNWMLQSTSAVEGIVGKGLFVSGLSGTHYSFGYLLACAPALALACFKINKCKIWLIIFSVFCLALALNAQRSAFVMVIMSFVFLLYYWKDSRKFLFFIFLGLSSVIALWLLKANLSEENVYHSTHIIERLSESDDVKGRIAWQYYGIKSILTHPFSSITREQYHDVISDNPFVSINMPAPHNHYINIGLDIGILFVVFLIVMFFLMKSLIKKFKINFEKINIDFYHGVTVAFIAVLGNALFHNNGIFRNEPATICVLAIIVAGASLKNNHKQ